jgi:SAM-dependent methyltransferase
VFVSHAPEAVKAICRRVLVLDGGRVVFDGHVREGLDRYHALMRSAAGNPVNVERTAPGAAADAITDGAWHRRAVGGRWREAGEWQYDLLRAQGLSSADCVLDVGCGSLAGAALLVPFLEPGHYCGFETDPALLQAGILVELPRAGVEPGRATFIANDRFDLAESPCQFDVAVANSLFRRLPLNAIARCIASVMPRLKPGGRFFATWLDNPDPTRFEPIAWPDGLTSYPDGEPYHYPYQMLATVCESLGYRTRRLCHGEHPRGESLMVIEPGVRER